MNATYQPGSSWRDRRVLVTGATGLVGGWLVELLLSLGSEVTALVHDDDYRSHFYRAGLHQRCEIVRGNVEDYRCLERGIATSEADTVIHLGAQTIVGTALRSPLATLETNVRGTYNLLEACREHSQQVQRVVVASSDKAYGDNQGVPYTETSPPTPRHPYDVSKLCGDLIAQTYAHAYGTPVAIARCGNIYGGGDMNWSRIVPGTIRSLLTNRRPVLRSDGRHVRDYLFVRDAATAYLALAEQSEKDGIRGQAFNFSGDAPRTVLDIVELLGILTGKQQLAPLIQNIARYEIPRQIVSADRARTALGWAPDFDLEAGLAETVEWYRLFLSESAELPG
jgi:CDP-glucose 4,6-dehydratase